VRGFLRFLESPEAQATFRKFGFSIPRRTDFFLFNCNLGTDVSRRRWVSASPRTALSPETAIEAAGYAILFPYGNRIAQERCSNYAMLTDRNRAPNSDWSR
jgi:hypothetical protein